MAARRAAMSVGPSEPGTAPVLPLLYFGSENGPTRPPGRAHRPWWMPPEAPAALPGRGRGGRGGRYRPRQPRSLTSPEVRIAVILDSIRGVSPGASPVAADIEYRDTEHLRELVTEDSACYSEGEAMATRTAKREGPLSVRRRAGGDVAESAPPGEEKGDAGVGGPGGGVRLCSTTEAAAVLGVSPRRIRQMVLAGQLEGERSSEGLFKVSERSVRLEQARRQASGRPTLRLSGRAAPSDLEAIGAAVARAVAEVLVPHLEAARVAEAELHARLEAEMVRRARAEARLEAARGEHPRG